MPEFFFQVLNTVNSPPGSHLSTTTIFLGTNGGGGASINPGGFVVFKAGSGWWWGGGGVCSAQEKRAGAKQRKFAHTRSTGYTLKQKKDSEKLKRFKYRIIA